jgi:hypothetical protein|nr:MAG TPA: hypothetical protein [Caudoviricetes sp.]
MYKKSMFKNAKRVDVIETTEDKIESYIEAYKRGKIIDLPPLEENEEIKEISIIGGTAIIYVDDVGGEYGKK